MLDLKLRLQGAERALLRLAELKEGPLDRRELEELGRAGVADARESIRFGRSPDGKAWRRTKDGRQAFGGSQSMQNAIRFEVIDQDTVRIGTDDVRSVMAHKARTGGSRINLRQEAIIPLSRAIEARVRAAGGWGRIKAFRIRTKSGKFFLVEREEGSRELTFLGVIKKSLMQYRRQHFGEGRHLRNAATRVEARIVSRFEEG
jgi:hypothetical protein